MAPFPPPFPPPPAGPFGPALGPGIPPTLPGPLGPPPMPPFGGPPAFGPPPPPMGPPMGPPMAPFGPPPMAMAPPPEPDPLTDPQVMRGILAGMTDEDLLGFVQSLSEDELRTLVQTLAGEPDLLIKIEDVLLDAEADERGPDYPSWFVKPPKPDGADIDTAASRADGYFQRLRQRMGEDLNFYELRTRGSFKIDEEDDDYERPPDTSLHDDAELTITTVSALPITYQIDARDAGSRDDAQRSEDALHAWRQHHEAAYAASGKGSLARAKAWYATVYGRVVTRRVLWPDDPDCPVRADLLDPATCCPTFDARGLVTMIRAYSCTVADIIGDFEDGSGEITRKLRTPAPEGSPPDTKIATRLFDSVEVVEYWDRWWYAVKLKDGRDIVKPTAHEYGFVPFVFTLVGSGRPAEARHPDPKSRTRSATWDTSGQWTALDEDMIDAGVSFFHFRKEAHSFREALKGKLAAIAATSDRPPVLWLQDVVAKAGNPEPEISYEAGAVNRGMKDNEQVTPLLLSPQAGVLQPLFQMDDQNRVTQSYPPAMYGATAGATTGNALEGLNESGRNWMTPVIEAVRQHEQACAQMDLTIWRDWGSQAGVKDRRGELDVPYGKRRRTDPNLSPTFVLTPGTVRRSGTRVRVIVTQLRLQNLPAFLNATKLGQEVHIPLRWFFERMGEANPEDLYLEWLEEQQVLAPDAQPAIRLEALRQRGTNADGQIDPWHLFLMQLEYARTLAPQGSPGGGGPGGNPTGMNTSAMNLAPNAIPQAGVGVGAGRPVSTGAGLLPPGPAPFPPGPGAPMSPLGPMSPFG